jgi:uncharacterized membrane protein
MSVTFAVIAGLIVPFVVSFLKNKAWSTQVKQLIAIAVSLVVGAGITVIDNGVSVSNWQDFLANFGVIFTVANVWYGQYFGDTAVNTKLESSGVGSSTLPSEIDFP